MGVKENWSLFALSKLTTLNLASHFAHVKKKNRKEKKKFKIKKISDPHAQKQAFEHVD